MSDPHGGVEIGRLPGGHDITVKPSEREDERRVRLNKELTVFRVGLAMLLAVFALSLYLLLAAPTPDDRRWAQSVVSALVGGVLGYLFKR